MKNKIVIIIIFIVLLFLCGIYFKYENTKLQVTQYDIFNEKIPKEFIGYKIIQISDFHNTKEKSLIEDLIKEIKNQKPDIIVITGDLIDSRNTSNEIAIDFIKKIKDIAPIYYVNGNHEARIIDEYYELKSKMSELGVSILENKSTTIEKENSIINIIGINDPSFTYESSINTIRYDKNNYTILLSHRPELFSSYAKENMDLVLVGHAHGGQIRIPFIGGVVAPNQGIFPKYSKGMFNENGTTMIVSSGIGNSIFPFRINNKPELVIISLNDLNKD